MKLSKGYKHPKLFAMILIIALIFSNMMPGLMNDGGKAYAAANSQILVDFANVSNWTNDGAVITSDGIQATIKNGNQRDYGSVYRSVSYDIDAFPNLTIKIPNVDAGAMWALKVATPGQGDVELEHDASKTGEFTYDLKGKTGWSGNKTFTIRLFVIDTSRSSKGYKVNSISISAKGDQFPVTQIDVTGGSLGISSIGGQLQMIAKVQPANATSPTVTWTVKNLDGTVTDIADISEVGLISANKNGEVKVVASAKDGSSIYGEAKVQITGQTEGLKELPEMIGGVKVWGDPHFDSDSIANSDSNQWRWLSYPLGRLSLNPTPGFDVNKGKMKPNLDLSLEYIVGGIGVNRFARDKQSMVQVSANGGTRYEASSVNTTWYPYKLTFNAAYNNINARIDGYEYFVDKDSIVRVFKLDGPAGKTMHLSGEGDGTVTWRSEDRILLVQSEYYNYAISIMGLNSSDNAVVLQETPSIDGKKWSIDIPFGSETGRVAYGYGFSTKLEGSAVAVERTKKVFNQPVSASLATTKAYWDNALRSAPQPTVWGITDVDTQGVTPEQHRRSYYAAWAYLLDTKLTELPEKDFNYRQAMLGRGSLWSSGHEKNPSSAAWESFYNIQFISYLDPATAWSALEGYMSLIEEDGLLGGEGLPTQKAHAAWVVYSMAPDINRLKAIYPAIKRHLEFVKDNPRWLYGNHNFAEERDISFASHFLYDVDYAIKIAKELGFTADIEMWQDLKSEMINDSRDWFFTPDKIYNFYFTEKNIHYDVDRNYDSPNYIAEMLVNDLPKDMADRLIAYYKAIHDPTKNLIGFDFVKYGDTANTAYGLFDKGLVNEGKQFIDSIMRHIIRVGEFSETLEPQNFKPVGVTPSSFTATMMIDYTWMKNKMRYEQGQPIEMIYPEELDVQNVADKISWIMNPAMDAKTLQLPFVPVGFEVSIASTEYPTIVSLDGTINATGNTERVGLELKVKKVSDGTTALTNKIYIAIPVKVQEVVVNTINNVNKINEKYDSVQMTVETKPDHASKKVIWSVSNLDGTPTKAALITEDGLLIATGNGTVKVVATSTSGVKGEMGISITNQTVSSLTYHKNAKASKEESSYSTASNAVDENSTTRWSTGTGGSQWISVDLGKKYDINKVVLEWEVAYAKGYQIQVSNDETNWSDVYTTSNGKGGFEVLSFTTTSTRYVRVLNTQTGPHNNYSLYEFKVYPDPASSIETPVKEIVVSGKDGTGTINKKNYPLQMLASIEPVQATDSRVIWEVYNVDENAGNIAEIDVRGNLIPKDNGTVKVVAKAVDGSGVSGEFEVTITGQDTQNVSLGKGVEVSSSDSVNKKENAVDGIQTTRWATKGSESNPWIYVDLGKVYEINRVVLNWEAAYAKGYRIQVSDDAAIWTDIYSTTDGKGSVEDISFDTVSTKFVRMYVTSKATTWGASLWEFEVYSSSAPVTVPSAPTGVNAIAGNGQAAVSFTASQKDGGSEITLYTVTAWNNGAPVNTATGTTSPITVSGLTNGTAYTFNVVAKNGVGNSVASEPSAAVTPIAPLVEPTAPSAPTGVNATAGNGQAAVSFSAPQSDGGSEITLYTVIAWNNGAAVNIATGTTSPITVSGLTNGTVYTFTVVATNAADDSSASAHSNEVTPSDELPPVPDQPENLAATSGDQTAVLSWNAVEESVTYSVYKYEGASAPADPSNWMLVQSGVTANTYTVTGLTNGTSYAFALKAVNAGGESNYSAATIAKPIAALPENPGGNGTPGNNGSLDNNGSSGNNGNDTSVVKSTTGTIIIPNGRAGEVSYDDEIVVSLLPGAAEQELRITIEKLLNTSNLLIDKETLVSHVYEITKNVTGNFKKRVTLSMKFDPSLVGDNQRVAIFYYDEGKKIWVEVGGIVNGNRITVEVDHFTKFAVMAVDVKKDEGGEPVRPKITFTDIVGHWGENAILSAVGRKIVSGYPDGMFKPNSSITRAEFTVMMVNALKLEGTGSALAFTDQDKIGAWATEAAAKAVEAGIVSGYKDGSFQPNARITRAEMASIIVRALRLSPDASATTGFADDKDIPKWAKDGVEAIRKLGIVNGRNGNKFAPSETATRAEAAVMLIRMLEHVNDQK